MTFGMKSLQLSLRFMFQSEESTIWDPDVTREGDKTTLKVDIALEIRKSKSELVQIKMSLNTIPKRTKSIKFRAFVET